MLLKYVLYAGRKVIIRCVKCLLCAGRKLVIMLLSRVKKFKSG